MDTQESLKILRFRFGREVTFQPVLRRGERFYFVDGRLRAESEILSWAQSGRVFGRGSQS
jgi:hypothetical protein